VFLSAPPDTFLLSVLTYVVAASLILGPSHTINTVQWYRKIKLKSLMKYVWPKTNNQHPVSSFIVSENGVLQFSHQITSKGSTQNRFSYHLSIHNSQSNFAQKCIQNLEFDSFYSRTRVYGKYLIDHFIGQCIWNSDHIGKHVNEMGLLFGM
jgi:hypothetical protein